MVWWGGLGGLFGVCEVRVPGDLLVVVGGVGGAVRLLRVGLLMLRVEVLEREVAEVAAGLEVQRRRIAELPLEVEHFRGLLAEALEDRRVLEDLLGEKGSGCGCAVE